MPPDRVLAMVVESDFFTGKVTRISSTYARIYQHVAGIKWRLEREPEAGEKLGEPLGASRILDLGPPIEGLPGVWIAYNFKNNTVKLIDIDLY
jgi:hypothetical protein